MRVIIPMSGLGERFRKAGYAEPKPLIPVEGEPMIERIIRQFPREWNFTFVCNEEHLARTPLRATLERAAPRAEIVAIPPHKKGPVWAVLEAARVSPGSVPDAEPCIVNYCDFGFTWDPAHFEKFARGIDGAVFCYRGFHPEYLRPTLYAYCREENGRMLEIKEKGHFTPDRTQEPASSGSYYFGSGALVKKYFRELMDKGPLLNGEGYVSLVYNLLARDSLDVRVYPIEFFFQWGTPEDLRDYEYWASVYRGYAPQRLSGAGPAGDRALQLLMPMAGRGSRFKGGAPKPLIPVLGRPMFQSAALHLPPARKKVFVVRDEFAADVRALEPGARVVSLSGVTDGQAVTCELGGPELDPDLPVLVSSCDHGMVWDAARWRELLARDPDVVVWGERNFPGANRTPKAFAYIDAAADGRISRVSVKEPLGPEPSKDLLLVGTFYFRRPALMLEAIQLLKARDIRVNGELYLDSVVNLCVEKGWKTFAFESRGYLCWGTPEALDEFSYWDRYFVGRASG